MENDGSILISEIYDGPWRNDACMGYALKAMRDAGIDEALIEKAMRCLVRSFDDVSVEEAAEFYQKANV